MGSQPEGELSEAKHELRLEMRQRRSRVADAARTVLQERLPSFLDASLTEPGDRGRLAAMALYAAKDDEAPCDSLLELVVGGSVAYPRVVDKQNLAFHRVSGPQDLSVGTFDVLEPPPESPVVLPGTLKLIVIPGLAFDRTGGRLGWGAGYYDAALPKHPDALRVGVAYSTQLIDAVPTEAWDVAVDLIITEEGVIRCKPCI